MKAIFVVLLAFLLVGLFAQKWSGRVRFLLFLAVASMVIYVSLT